MHRGRTVLAMDCALAGAQCHRGRPLNSIVSCHFKSVWIFDQLGKLWKAMRGKPGNELLSVEFDETEIRVRAIDDSVDPGWNQTLLWSNIKRVCWKDGGMSSSDVILISQTESDAVVIVPTEARGGHVFFGELCNRNLFPEHVWRRALGDTGGGTYCWPEK